MGEGTKIEWADNTFSPWIGCTKVSEACRNCYAEELMDHRFGKAKWGHGKPRALTSDANWRKPLTWNKKAAKAKARAEEFGVEPPPRPRVFCSSLSDVFDPEVPIVWLRRLLDIIDETPDLDWLLLTKRPEKIEMRVAEALRGYRYSDVISHRFFGDVWLGVTVENQAAADKRIPILLDTPAKKRFLSMEPLLGPVDLTRIEQDEVYRIDALTGTVHQGSMSDVGCLPGIDWVIAGGESGPNARPSNPDWFRSIRDQCSVAGVPFFFKQWGEYRECLPPSEWAEEDPSTYMIQRVEDKHLVRIGKKRAGRILDGRTHDEVPCV